MSERGWQKVGTIGVDAGICWIGDPCYILHKTEDERQDMATELGLTWDQFCDKLRENVTQFNFPVGHPWLGVVVSTGYGDGTYPVFVRYNGDGQIMEAKVVFSGEDEEY